MTFRRGGWRLLPWYLYLALCWVFVALFTVAFSTALLLRDRWTAERVFTTALIGFLVYPSTRMAFAAHRRIRGFREQFLTIDAGGVRFCLPGTGEVRLAWEEVDGITSAKRWLTTGSMWTFGYCTTVYTLATARGSYEFTSMEIPRAARAARMIAASTRNEQPHPDPRP